MFKCKKCTALESEIQYLRDQNKSLVDRVMALSSPMALEAVQQPQPSYGYYGDGKDYEYKVNEYGEEVLVKND